MNDRPCLLMVDSWTQITKLYDLFKDKDITSSEFTHGEEC